MDHLHKLKTQISNWLLLGLLANGMIAAAGWWVGTQILSIDPVLVFCGVSVLIFLSAAVLANFLSGVVIEPVKNLWQAILHVTPNSSDVSAPNLEKIHLGRELVTSLCLQVYQLASQETNKNKDLSDHRTQMVQAANIVSHLPLPLFVFNKEQLVTHASDSALGYCKLESAQLLGKPIFDSLHLEFPNEFTLDAWITECQQHKITDTAYWERVRVRLQNEEDGLRQCEMVGYYNRDNPSGTEFIITLFDQTERYKSDDNSISFISLAVHELRMPLTLLRGYIEVFEDELEGKLDAEMTDFMHKMQVAAAQLTAFVNNILNVARVEDDQLTLQLTEENWGDVLKRALDDMSLRAQVHGKTIESTIASDLPTVAVDSVSIQEVIYNLIDNAIKYSRDSKKIVLESKLDQNGMVVTTIEDFGVGIPTSVLPNLFEKFYRNHRTRESIGGTGLGLYLSKAIITAHGGQIWAQSKEDEGSTFGFSVQPYAQLADELKTSNNTDIVRNAHGWIKNHSLYRR